MSNKFSDFVVKYKWLFIGLFIAFTIFSGVMVFHNDIVYDLSSYVPGGSNTEKAVTLLKKEFDDKGSAYIMVNGVTLEEANSIAAELMKIDGVAVVTFDSNKDFKNNSVLYTVSLEYYDATNESNATIKGILSYLNGKDASVCGQSATSYFTRRETVESILKVGLIIVAAILIMLLFTSTTYFEIVIMIIVFGVAVVLNMGTNFLFGGISYISNLVGLVLQLALSIDYSVVLLHRFMEERKESDANEAASTALRKAVSDILSSSLTTIAGLCALMFMTLPIGVELGLSLAKGIVFSLISVLFLEPALLVIFDKLIAKTKHKKFVPDIIKPVRGIIRARKIIVPVFLILTILACVGQFNNDYSFNLNSSTKTVIAQKEIAENFGYQNTLVVIVPKGSYEKERELTEYVLSKDAVNRATGLSTLEAVEGLKLIDKITISDAVAVGSSFGLNEITAKVLFSAYKAANDPDLDIEIEDYSVEALSLFEFAAGEAERLGMNQYSDRLSQITSVRRNFESEAYSRIMFNVDSEMESEKSYKLVKELYAELGQFYDEFYLAGESAACYDMSNAFPRDNLFVCVFTCVFILVILLFTFKNFFLPIILMLLIQGGIWINFAIPFLQGTPIFFIGYLLISAVQMGATIDYAIILTGRYYSLKKTSIDRFSAMAEAENAVFPTIITSGVILTVAGFALGLASAGIVAELGMVLGIGAAISVLLVLFVLPSFLLVCDNTIEKSGFNNLLSLIKKLSKKKTK